MKLFAELPLEISKYVFIIQESSSGSKEIIRTPYNYIWIKDNEVVVSCGCGLNDDYVIGENAFTTEQTAIAYVLLQNTKDVLLRSMILKYEDFDCLFSAINHLASVHSLNYLTGELDDICDYKLLPFTDNNICRFKNTKTKKRFDIYVSPDDTCSFSYIDSLLNRHTAKTASEAINKYHVGQ